MPDIGATLREARMRARIDISELEAETKIRAKYLRALENEEWDLLPGPTYVKSFLREYADALGLDGKLLVEEYKLSHERPSDFELQPISPRSRRDQQRRRRRGSGATRDIAVAVVVLLVLGGLILIGQVGGGSGNDSGGPAPVTTTTKSATQPKGQKAKPKPPAPQRVRLTLAATGPVYVCLRAGDKVLLRGRTLAAGQQVGPYKAKRFAMTFGNSNVTMRVDGRKLAVSPSSAAIGYAVDRNGRHALTGRLPTCGV
jgi:transcriptional regulator with XRE-family HTH domain